MNTQEIPYGYCQCGCGQKTKIATENNKKKGWIKGQPLRFVHRHWSRVQPKTSAHERFWQKVDKRGPDECWLWVAGVDTHGYGQLKVDGKTKLAHRLSYEFANGPIPEGQLVCHSCDTPRCCNPAHLWSGTNAQNIEDMKQKGRAKSGGAHGTMSGNAKLDEDRVAEIRRLYTAKEFNQYQLGDMFGVSRGTICDIVRHVTWKSVSIT